MTNKTKLDTDNMCRLCTGALDYYFKQKILNKFEVAYYKCINCHSLQTEKPFWLEEAYKNSNLSRLDTGAAQRNLRNLAACYAISKLIRAKNVIDIGGGDGLLCRLLRDYKINCYVRDKYASPTYVQGFTQENFKIPDMIIGFEILEHYENPISDLDELFNYKPRALLLSTMIFDNQKEDWWYISPESGQHVFFYSRKALLLIAKKYDYELIVSSNYILFIKKTSLLKKMIIKLILKNIINRIVKSFILFLPTPGLWEDHLLQVKKTKDNN